MSKIVYQNKIYVDNVNRTYSKSFSKKQVLPKIIIEMAKSSKMSPYISVLDYGSGKDAYGTQILKEYFADVTSYDIGSNFNTVWHDADALNRLYDIIMMSNVINIQPSVENIKDVLYEGKDCLSSNGHLYCNLPKHPRKCEITNGQMLNVMNEVFDSVIYNMVSNVYIGGKK